MIDLLKCPLFKGIDSHLLLDLLQKVNYNIRAYQENDLIVQSGDACDFLICVVSGKVRGEMVDCHGKVIKIEDISAPRMLAAAFIFGNKKIFPVNVVATENVKLLYIPRHDLLKLFQINESILLNFLNSISSRSQFLSDKIRFLSFSTIKEKLASHFLKLRREEDGFYYLRLTQNQMAETFGVTRPALARVIKSMADEGIISVEGKKIGILNRSRLSKIAYQES